MALSDVENDVSGDGIMDVDNDEDVDRRHHGAATIQQSALLITAHQMKHALNSRFATSHDVGGRQRACNQHRKQVSSHFAGKLKWFAHL